MTKHTEISVPEEIQYLAQQQKLGQLCKVYPISRPQTGTYTTGAICIMLSMVYLITTLSFILNMPFLFWSLIPGIISLLIGIYIVSSPRFYRYMHVYLYQEGFIYHKRSLQQAYRWDQIQSVESITSADPRTTTIMQYLVQHKDGYTVRLNHSIKNLAECMSIVSEEYIRHLASGNTKLIPSQRVQVFSKYTFDNAGIHHRQETIPWQDMQALTIQKGTIILLKKDESVYTLEKNRETTDD